MMLFALTFPKKMGKMLRIQLRQTLTIIYSLTYDEHGGTGEVIIVNQLGQVLELTAIDALVGPRQVVAGSDGGVLRIFLQQFALHIVDDDGTEEDAHR